jgi:hypothetical protein
MQLGTILVPYDFSSHSEAALKRGRSESKAAPPVTLCLAGEG